MNPATREWSVPGFLGSWGDKPYESGLTGLAVALIVVVIVISLAIVYWGAPA